MAVQVLPCAVVTHGGARGGVAAATWTSHRSTPARSAMLAPIASKVRPRQPATASEGAPCARAKGRMAPATADDV